MNKPVLSNHAKNQLKARGISEDLVWQVVSNPQQKIIEGDEKVIYQSAVYDESGREYLIRIFR